ncbi:MAG: beta-galactosidase trimerization domain-containing protein [Clostridia bacterium]|nr:beta-galactosidase trimerization domain-containing protein [Clostridia bacterium]
MNRRQVHLDFHTSEKIEGIGSAFSKENFQQMLKKGHVDSITVFSKCHHGWSYHPTKVNKMHPHLNFDLLGAQIEAAHEIGVKAPVYISAGFDEKTAMAHPEWILWTAEQYKAGEIIYDPPRYHQLCLNTPYLDELLAEIKEACENYDGDGIFLDIVHVDPCYCETCRKQMAERGLDVNNPDDVKALAEEVYANYIRRVRETVDLVKPGHPVFHNGGHIRHGRRDLAHANTHLELESLPTGGWGYDHFPMSAAYARTLDMEYLGMTGKFHKAWGEFGGYKHPNALRYEVALSAANGAKSSIGDQLHPTGFMDNATYTLIGEAYKTVEEREPWLDGYKNVKGDIAVFSSEAWQNYNGIAKPSWESLNWSKGCTRILLESNYLFDFVDTETDLSNYKLLILPDICTLDDKLAKKINDYIAAGGKVLASYESGLNAEKNDFLIDFGCKFEMPSEYKPTYIRPDSDIDCLPAASYLVYEDAMKVTATTGKATAMIDKPYFNRTLEHFCSHLHTPYCGERYGDAVVMTSNTAYFAHKIFLEYFKHGSIYAKEIVRAAIEALIGDAKTIKTNLPAQGVITVTENGDSMIVHTLYASPVLRGEKTQIIEDLIPIYDTTVSVKSDKRPKSVKLVPENKKLKFKYKDGKVEFTIPKFECWQMTEIKF